MKERSVYIAIFCIFFALACTSVNASFARVESMGKHATFFMDDINIFDNAANVNVFPNFLIGEMGSYSQGNQDLEAINEITGNSANFFNPKYNRDPVDPWFGGIFSYSFNKKEEGNLYPQLSVGGAFNRKDQLLYSMVPDSVIDKSGSIHAVPDPVTNTDGFLGYTFANGGMIGTHMYVAIQDGANVKNGLVQDSLYTSSLGSYLLKGDLGFNWPLARNIDGELSFAWYSIQFGPATIDPEYSFSVRSRLFSTFELINGELVPIVNYSVMNAPGIARQTFDLGIGINASLDRGFFWLGVQGIFSKTEVKGYSSSLDGMSIYNADENMPTGKEILNGAQISFGIERNIWWDWMVVRVGGRKLIASVKKDNKNYFIRTNAVSDGTPNDHIGWGIGINIEEKLKVDATMAEDFLYSFGNLLSGPQHHVISRISATYSF